MSTIVTVNIHEAKTQLSKLVDRAVKGEAFVIAKAGKPLVRVTARSGRLASPTRPGYFGHPLSVSTSQPRPVRISGHSRPDMVVAFSAS